MTVMMNSVWDRTTEALSERRAALAPLVLFGLFLPLALIGILMPQMNATGSSDSVILGLLTWGLSLVTMWAGLAITALALDPAVSRGAAVQAATRRFLPVVGIGLMTLVIVLVLAAPIPVALVLGGMDAAAFSTGKITPGSIDGGVAVFVTVYSLLLAALLIWAYARFVVLITPIVVEERRGLGVYRRSFGLTRRIAWKVIGVIVLYGVVSSVASIAAKGVFGTVFAVLLGWESPIVSIATQIIVAGVSTVFALLATVFLASLYRAAQEAIVARS